MNTFCGVVWFLCGRKNDRKTTEQKKKQYRLPFGNASKEIKDIFVKIIWSLLMKLNVPNEEAEEIVEQMRGGHGMGFLFENMDKMDIQAERRNTQREKERADKAEAEKQLEKRQNEEKIQQLENENQKLKTEYQEAQEEIQRLKEKVKQMKL